MTSESGQPNFATLTTYCQRRGIDRATAADMNQRFVRVYADRGRYATDDVFEMDIGSVLNNGVLGTRLFRRGMLRVTRAEVRDRAGANLATY